MWRVWITFSLNIPTKHIWFLICTDMIESILNNIGIWPIHLFCAQVLSHVRLFATPWTVAHQAPLSIGILQATILKWVAMPSSRGSSQPRDRTPVSHIAGLPHRRQIVYRLSHQGSPRIPEWLAYPFSRAVSWPRNRTSVAYIAGEFLTSWTAREILCITTCF